MYTREDFLNTYTLNGSLVHFFGLLDEVMWMSIDNNITLKSHKFKVS